MTRLSVDIKTKIKTYLLSSYMDNSIQYKDVQKDWVNYGFKGLNNFTDEELVEDLESSISEDDEEMSDLLKLAQLELSIDKIINE